MLKDKDLFLAAAQAVTTGPLDEEQLATLDALLEAAQADGKSWCIGWTAYLLATAWHEWQFRAPCDPAALAATLCDGSDGGKYIGQYILAGRGDAVAFGHCRKAFTGNREGAEDVVPLAMEFRDQLVASGWH